MSENKAASRYAKSIIDLAREHNVLEDVKNDMILIEQVIDQNSELEAILKNPIVPVNKKSGILENLFGGRINQITLSFLKLVVNKGRSAIVFAASKQFIAQYNSIKGVVTAEITSAIELTDNSRAEVIAIVKNEMGASEVILKEKINADLIGGFILKVEDRQFDASISNSLNKLKKEFAHKVV